MKLIIHPDYGLYEKEHRAFCDSLQVAESFGKRHDNVLRDIRNLDCSAEFDLLNFEETSYKDSWNHKQIMYLMTKDGFTFLVMGYRGKKAAAFKEAYIKRFNEMEQFIKEAQGLRLENPALTKAIRDTREDPRSYHYSNEFDMINRLVLGMSTREFKAFHQLPANTPSIRPYLSTEQIYAIEMLQRVNVGLQYSTPNYHQRKEILTKLLSSQREVTALA